jgi:hypothetical protein
MLAKRQAEDNKENEPAEVVADQTADILGQEDEDVIF